MFSAYLNAIRPCTLFLAITGAVCSAGLAVFASKFNLYIFLLILLTSVLLQILANLANDYGDFKKGTDTSGKRIGPTRALQSGNLSIKTIKIMIVINILAILCSGISLIYIALNQKTWLFLLFLGLGITSIVAAIKYTVGNNPYGYQGFGDICSFIFFGPIAVIGGYFLYTNNLSFMPILPAISLGLLTTSVLNINNMRDFTNDKLCKKITFAIVLGLQNAKIYHLIITSTALISLIIFNLIYAKHWYQWLYLLIFFAPITLMYKIYHVHNPLLLNPYLKFTSITIFILNIGFITCINLI